MIARRFRERHHWLERCGFPGDLQPAAAQPLVLTHAHQLVGRVKGILPGWQLRGSRLTGERRRSCQADRRGWAPSVNVSPLGCRHPRQEAVANAVTTIRRQWRPHLTPSLPLALVFWRRSARMTARGSDVHSSQPMTRDHHCIDAGGGGTARTEAAIAAQGAHCRSNGAVCLGQAVELRAETYPAAHLVSRQLCRARCGQLTAVSCRASPGPCRPTFLISSRTAR